MTSGVSTHEGRAGKPGLAEAMSWEGAGAGSTPSAGHVECVAAFSGGLFPHDEKVTASDVGKFFNGWCYLGEMAGDDWFAEPPALADYRQKIKCARRTLEGMLQRRLAQEPTDVPLRTQL